MTWDQLTRKFEECAAVAQRPPAPEQVAAAVAMAHELESLDDATEILRALS
jgi:hypothetical protein